MVDCFEADARGLNAIMWERSGNRSAAGSERIPGRARREFQITDIGTQSQPDAGADWNQHNAAGGERGHAEAADEIGRAIDPGDTRRSPAFLV